MINGSAKVRIDDKGRGAIPTLFRDFLASDKRLILTFHPHGCLVLYPGERFDAVERQIVEMGNVGYLDAHLEEILIGCAEQVSLDGAGRLMFHSHLRERANLRRDALLFGVGDSIRIWDEERWEQRHLMLLARLQDEGLSEPWRKLRI